jgi:hypothetical protein
LKTWPRSSSKDPGSAVKGGDLDWAAPGNYVKEFTEAVVSLPKGKMTETPVKTQFGYHVIRVDDVRDAQLPKFEDVKPQISQQLHATENGQVPGRPARQGQRSSKPVTSPVKNAALAAFFYALG